MEVCDQQIWNVFDQFEITIPCSAIYFLEAGACVSLKAVTRGSAKSQKNSANLDI